MTFLNISQCRSIAQRLLPLIFISFGFAMLLPSLSMSQTIDTLWFEGWEGNWQDNWDVTFGTWEVGAPTSGPDSAHSGQHCAATVLGGDYPPNANTQLVRHTPFVVPSASQNPRLRFWHWFSMTGVDAGSVQIKVGNGVWQTIYSNYTNYSGGWTNTSIDLRSYADSTVQVAFLFVSDNAFQAPGWYIDDVALITGPIVFNTFENWESGMGDWYAELGTWQVGVPTSGPGSAYSGQNCAATVLDGNYPPFADSRLRSPSFVVPDASQNPRLRFWHWYDIFEGDGGSVEISTDNGTTWQTVSPTYNLRYSGGWTYTSIDLSAYAGLSVQIAFRFTSNGSSELSGWYIDEVAVITGPIVFNTFENWENGLGDWSAERGIWQVGVPARTPAPGPDTAYSRPQCAGTVLSGNYPPFASTRLISPKFLLSRTNGNPNLRFQHWYSISGGDNGYVQVRTEDSPTWNTILGPYTNTSGGVWTSPFADLTAYADSIVQIAFLFTSDGGSEGAGWYIDDIRIVGSGPYFSPNKTTIPFGIVGRGQSKQDSMTVTNTGGDTLMITSAVSRNPQFSVTPSSAIIVPSQAQKFYVTFTPPASGFYNSHVVFTHNGAGGGDSIRVNGRAWDKIVWMGTADQAWSNPQNWSRNDTIGAVPAPTDSVIIPGGTPNNPRKGIGLDYVGALNIYSGGNLTLLSPARLVVNSTLVVDDGSLFLIQSSAEDSIGGDVVLNGTLQVDAFASAVIRSSRSWIRGPSSAFIPGNSIIPFSGAGSFSGNFNSVRVELGSVMTSTGNIAVNNQCEVRNLINLRSPDSLIIQRTDPAGLIGSGKVGRGTIRRGIQPNLPERYRFESDSTYVQFSGIGAYPSFVTVTTFPDTIPSHFGTLGIRVPSTVDPVTNTIKTDSLYPNRRWVIVRPPPTGKPQRMAFDSLAVKRVYAMTSDGDTNLRVRLSFRYEQSEVPPGVPEDSLVLYTLDATGVGVDGGQQQLPNEFALYQNYPNPFNPTTTFRYELPVEAHMTLKIYNILGQEIKMLVQQIQTAGHKSIDWNSRNNMGIPVGSGVYFYRMEADGIGNYPRSFTQVKKLLLLK